MNNPSSNPFAARPVLLPHVIAQADAQGRLQLRQKTPPRHRMRDIFARYLPMFPSRCIYLDDQGSFFWREIDGRKTLGEIEILFREHFRLEPQRSRDGVIVFTKMLMRRGLIGLQLSERTDSVLKGEEK